jgi:hypothetical protein
MPQRRNPTHPHFIPMLSRPPVRPRNLPQQPHTMKTAWHYTTGQKAKLIFESGELKPTGAFIEAQERPILWFSKNQEWEQTANKMIMLPDGNFRQLTTDETRNMGEGLFRFGIPSHELIQWPRLARSANMRSKIQRALEESGLRQGADFREWCGLLEPVSIAGLTCQTMTDSGWQALQEAAI